VVGRAAPVGRAGVGGGARGGGGGGGRHERLNFFINK